MTVSVIFFLKDIFLLCFYDARTSKLVLNSPSGEILRGYKSITVHIARLNAKIAVKLTSEENATWKIFSCQAEDLRSPREMHIIIEK